MKTFNTLRIGLASTGATLAFLAISAIVPSMAHAAITGGELSVGSSGSEVTQLQQFLSADPTIYPSGDVTGYFGSLTEAAVMQFQVAYGISRVGQVGPVTQAAINTIMASGLSLNTTVPAVSNVSVSVNPTSATISWTTNELALGQVFYDTSPIQANAATGPHQTPYIGGTPALANSNPSYSNSQSIQLTGLQASTTYYYIVRSIDQSGNITMTMSQSFQTN